MKIQLTSKLTPEQLNNWRILLSHIYGPTALHWPEKKIQQLRDEMENAARKKD